MANHNIGKFVELDGLYAFRTYRWMIQQLAYIYNAADKEVNDE